MAPWRSVLFPHASSSFFCLRSPVSTLSSTPSRDAQLEQLQAMGLEGGKIAELSCTPGTPPPPSLQGPDPMQEMSQQPWDCWVAVLTFRVPPQESILCGEGIVTLADF